MEKELKRKWEEKNRGLDTHLKVMVPSLLRLSTSRGRGSSLFALIISLFLFLHHALSSSSCTTHGERKETRKSTNSKKSKVRNNSALFTALLRAPSILHLTTMAEADNYQDDMADEEGSSQKTNKKGRGHGQDRMEIEQAERYKGKGGVFDSLAGDTSAPGGPLKSVEGWIVFVTGIHEETQEEDLKDKFAEYGPLKNIELPLDRRTGFVKGYALIEYEKKDQAQKAIDQLNGDDFRGQPLGVTWAFLTGPIKGGKPQNARNRLGGRESSSSRRGRERT
jgi:RNA-binding protein 8A